MGQPPMPIAPGAVNGFPNPANIPGVSPQTVQGLGAITNAANAGTPNLQGGNDFIARLLAGGPGAAEQYLTNDANGNNLGTVNPYLNSIINDTGNQISNQVQDIYSGGGRYGGATMNRDLADRLYANRAGTLAQDYEANQARRMQAAGAIDQSQIARLGQGLSGVSMIPGMDAARYTGANALLSAGDYANALPWLNLQNYGQTIQPFLGTQSTTQEPRHPLATFLGALSGLGGIFGGGGAGG